MADRQDLLGEQEEHMSAMGVVTAVTALHRTETAEAVVELVVIGHQQEHQVAVLLLSQL